jgi:hypothetical protein
VPFELYYFREPPVYLRMYQCGGRSGRGSKTYYLVENDGERNEPTIAIAAAAPVTPAVVRPAMFSLLTRSIFLVHSVII